MTAPFHYRLDWQIWIDTTASMEGMLSRYPDMPVDVPDTLYAALSKAPPSARASSNVGNTLDCTPNLKTL